jgi:hypothetical protein
MIFSSSNFCRWADTMQSIGIDGNLRPFEHPFVQACSMFLGEILCLLVFKAIYYHFKRKNVSTVLWIGLNDRLVYWRDIGNVRETLKNIRKA